MYTQEQVQEILNQAVTMTRQAAFHNIGIAKLEFCKSARPSDHPFVISYLEQDEVEWEKLYWLGSGTETSPYVPVKENPIHKHYSREEYLQLAGMSNG